VSGITSDASGVGVAVGAGVDVGAGVSVGIGVTCGSEDTLHPANVQTVARITVDKITKKLLFIILSSFMNIIVISGLKINLIFTCIPIPPYTMLPLGQ
jgi:hypothetical protein